MVFKLFTSSAVAQNLQLIDSIKEQLTSAQGEKKFELLNDLAWEYRWAYPDSTIHYAKQANTLGHTLNLSKSMAQPINFMGVALNYKGNRLSAFEHFEEALKISTTQSDSVQIAHSNNNLGRLFFEQGLLLADPIVISLKRFPFLKNLMIQPDWHILIKVWQTFTNHSATTKSLKTII